MKRRQSSTIKLEYENSSDEDVSFTPKQSKTTKRVRKSKRNDSTKTTIKFEPPNNWEEELNLIEEMRSNHDAPVDTLGAEALPERDKGDKVYRYQCLISVMLSSQTKDEITAQAIHHLQKFGLTPENILNAKQEELEELIKPAGFYRRKAEYIQRTSKILLDQYDGDVPKTIEELIALPGVGYKMGYIALRNAWNICDGIGIDVHMHTICNRLKWVKSKTPDETGLQLQSWLPKKYWESINLLLVGFGQQICTSVKPKCSNCLLKDLCPSSQSKSTKRKANNSQIESKRKVNIDKMNSDCCDDTNIDDFTDKISVYKCK